MNAIIMTGIVYIIALEDDWPETCKKSHMQLV